jgi:hypothetical protein
MKKIDRCFVLFVLALCGGLTAATAQAEVYCVADAAALRDAISDATYSPGDHDIRIRRGVIQALASQQTYYNAIYVTMRETNSLVISGGWSGWNGTCVTQTMDARLTAIDAEFSGRIFYILRDDGGTGAFTLRNLTLRRGHARDVNGAGGCLAFHAQGIEQAGTNVFENLIASDCQADAVFGALALYVGYGNTTVRNLLLRGNRARYDSAMNIRTNGNAFLSNLTVVDNVSAEGHGALDLTADGDGAIVMSNSLFWNNTGNDVYLAYGDVYFIRNLYADPSVGQLPTPGLTAGNLQDADAGLAADGVHLGKGSAAIDYGVNLPYGGATAFDLEGNPRIQGEQIDLGAIEYTGLFSHGFE